MLSPRPPQKLQHLRSKQNYNPQTKYNPYLRTYTKKKVPKLTFSLENNTATQVNSNLLSERSRKNANNKSLSYRKSSKLNCNSYRLISNKSYSKKLEVSTRFGDAPSSKNIEERKDHQLGKNCRIVLIDKSGEIQHFLEVKKLSSVFQFLRRKYPRISYYKSVPSQLTLDYLMMDGQLNGQFLNGQTLYLKPSDYSNSNHCDIKGQVSLQNFQILTKIGSGGFSKVYLVRFRENGEFYAMKVIDKDVIIKNKKKKIIRNQRNIMKDASHPFVIDMKFSFETEKYLIFVMEYCVGGELFGLIKKTRRISEQMARFYIIQIFLGLAYLHKNNIIYRDIKPQNILLNKDGHVKIADLGLAKPDMFEGQLAYSFCGSPEYMSPQMILQIGHTYPVDYYCMGALLYELLTGLPPFYSRDPDQIYEAVLQEQLHFPQDLFLTYQCKNLLQGLLNKDSKLRLGSLHGIKQILSHPWFGKKNYTDFLEKKIQPPVTFNSIGKLNLDTVQDDNQIKDVQTLKKDQKKTSKDFKIAMKDFYHDFRLSGSQHIELNKNTARISNTNSKHSLERNRRSLKNSCSVSSLRKTQRTKIKSPQAHIFSLTRR